MKGFLVFALIICMALLYVGAQEKVEEVVEPEVVQPVPEPVTRLKVKLIDDLSDQYIKLENCIVYIKGKLHIAEDSFDYTNTFIEGDRYEITIHIRTKK
jgi:hypothetical protein